MCPERLQSGKDRRCLLFATQIFPPVHAHTVYCIETFALTLRCVLHAFVRACHVVLLMLVLLLCVRARVRVRCVRA